MTPLSNSAGRQTIHGPKEERTIPHAHSHGRHWLILLMTVYPWLAYGQWLTQSFPLVPGWNAVYLHVDASYTSLDDLIGSDSANPIAEVWKWNPVSTSGQIPTSPLPPTGAITQWTSWIRSSGPSSVLQYLIPNTAYLVRVEGTASYTWNLKGKPTPPSYSWTSSGLNFLAFPTPANLPPTFEQFLSNSPDLTGDQVEVIRYVGGDLGSENPKQEFALDSTLMARGQAFWIRSQTGHNQFFGPFELTLQHAQGIHFGENLSTYRIRLRNRLDSSLMVNLQLLWSESPPTGQPAIIKVPPVLVRGVINTTNLTYTYSTLDSPRSWSLEPKGKPGSEVEITLGINRNQTIGLPGDLYAGILQFTDGNGLSQIDLPVSATVTDSTGLWVGAASVNQVRHYLKSFAKNNDGTTAQSSTGAYTSTGTNTSLGSVGKAFPLRLILHHDGFQPRLLQRVFVGTRSNLAVLTTDSRILDKTNLANSLRLSSAHLPWIPTNPEWLMSGDLQPGSVLATTVGISHDDHASNPFLHTYHPDHDNLDALFSQPLPQGEESYRITRSITLSLTPPTDDFTSLTSVHRTRTGVYDETLTLAGKGTESRQYEVRGVFSLNRISEIPVLSTP